MGEFDDVIAEFLIESREGLDVLDNDLLALESSVHDHELIARIFRCFHTVKGTSGFLGFGKLEELTHAGENLLSFIREGVLKPNAEITSALLETVDAVRTMLVEVENTGNDGQADYSALSERLRAICRADAETPSDEPAHAEPVDESGVHAAAELEPEAVASVADAEAADDTAPEVAQRGSSPTAQTHGGHRAGDGVEERHAAPLPENVRVDVGLLDKLVDLAGELVLTRNHLVQLAKSREDPTFASAAQRLNFVTAQLQDGIMRMRMQPISTLFSRFPRVVRDLARACHKQVRIELDCRDTELDKSLVETIKDPLVHLLRNCVDHGIEAPEVRSANGKNPEGRIIMRAFHQNGMVHIEIADDGGGIALGRVKSRALERGLISEDRAVGMSDSEVAALIFLPGFSTAEHVTNISGRGVGMDVVRSNVEQVGGTVEVNTRTGLGTTFTLKIPLTLAIIPALIVRSGSSRFALPQVNVLELVRLDAAADKPSLEWIHGAPVFRLRGRLLPVVFLQEALGGMGIPQPANDTSADAEAPPHFLVVVQSSERYFGLVVDAVLDQQEIVVKPLPKLLTQISVFAGATLLGDGKVALILDILGIATQSRLVVPEVRDEAAIERARALSMGPPPRTLLLLQGQDDARLAVALDEVSRLETIEIDSVESGGAFHVVQYRGEIMPLVRASEVLPERRSRLRATAMAPVDESKTLSVVVLEKHGRSLGLVVDDVLDVVESRCELRRLGCRAGVAGTVVVQDRVTEVLDLDWIVNAAGLNTDADSYATG
jgi:two-component system chemotaxis sensor kinase CheA